MDENLLGMIICNTVGVIGFFLLGNWSRKHKDK